MSVALLVQSPDTHGEYQTLIVPNYTTGDVNLYHRLATGSRGRADAWRLSSVSELPTDSQVMTRPVAVRLTDNDYLYIATGKVTTLAIKCISASAGALINLTPESHAVTVLSLVDRLLSADSTLGEYLVDSRSNSVEVDIKPLSEPVVEVSPDISTPAPASAPATTPTSRVAVSVDLATIPDSKWAKSYLQRTISGNITEFDIFDVAMRENQNVLIKGHAGSGKTMSVMAYASARGYRYYNISSHIGVEPSQLFGKWNPSEDGHFHWQDGAVTDLVRNGGILLINEVNFLPERVTTVLFSLLDDRREIQLMDKDGEVVRAHKDLVIIADMNPNYRGTRELNQAWNDRFCAHQLEYPYDPDIERKLIGNKAVLDMANQLRDRFEQEELQTPISTRGLVAFMANIQNLGLDYAMYSYVNLFHVREQQPVRLVIDTYRHNIEQELGISKPTLEAKVESIG